MDPDTIEVFRGHGKEMIDYICLYNETLDAIPVAPVLEPGFLAPELAGLFKAKEFLLQILEFYS